jgi:hypothetical protein
MFILGLSKMFIKNGKTLNFENLELINVSYNICRNLSFGFVIKTRACKSAGQEWSPGVTFHVPGSVGECERMNPHTPKWVPILGVGFSMDFRWIPEYSENDCRGKNSLDLKVPYTIENFLEHRCLKWVHMTHLGT